jgi:hypothetical protein
VARATLLATERCLQPPGLRARLPPQEPQIDRTVVIAAVALHLEIKVTGADGLGDGRRRLCGSAKSLHLRRPELALGGAILESTARDWFFAVACRIFAARSLLPKMRSRDLPPISGMRP